MEKSTLDLLMQPFHASMARNKLLGTELVTGADMSYYLCRGDAPRVLLGRISDIVSPSLFNRLGCARREMLKTRLTNKHEQSAVVRVVDEARTEKHLWGLLAPKISTH